MLIIGILCFGILAGTVAAFVVPSAGTRDVGRNLIAGLVGSFVGGLAVSLLAGDGLRLRPSGIIGSVLGAIVVLVVLDRLDRRAA